MYICIYVCIYVYIHIHIHTYTYLSYVFVCVRVSVCLTFAAPSIVPQSRSDYEEMRDLLDYKK